MSEVVAVILRDFEGLALDALVQVLWGEETLVLLMYADEYIYTPTSVKYLKQTYGYYCINHDWLRDLKSVLW